MLYLRRTIIWCVSHFMCFLSNACACMFCFFCVLTSRLDFIKQVPEEKKKIRSDDVHDTHHSLPSFSNNQEDETECEETQMNNERPQPLKRLRLRGQDCQPLRPMTNIATSPPSKRPKLEDNALHQGSSGMKPQNKPESSDGNPRIEAPLVRPPDDIVDKGKQPASAQVLQRGRELTSGRSSPSTPSKERTVKSGKFLMPNNTIPRTQALIIPKDEPVDEVPDYGMPIAVILPGIGWIIPLIDLLFFCVLWHDVFFATAMFGL